jgi:aminopeptidase
VGYNDEGSTHLLFLLDLLGVDLEDFSLLFDDSAYICTNRTIPNEVYAVDSRIEKLAEILVDHSTKVEEGDNVIIQFADEGIDLASEIYKECSRRGANPLILTTPIEVVKSYYEVTPEKYLQNFPSHYHTLVRSSDVIISLRSDKNTKALSSVDPKRMSRRLIAVRKIADERLKKRWCVVQYPAASFAQDAEMSLTEYESFVYNAMLRDWVSEGTKMRRLKELFDSSRDVRIIGQDTDLFLSIKGRTTIVDDGTHNMPGGEIFTAPIETSAEGKIFFDLPAVRYGKEVQDIRLEFEKGRITDYSAGKNVDLLKAMIETDKGSSRLGELGIGMNWGITRFTKNILLDEKIGGTIHLAIGKSYKECGGKNRSAIHWDMIKTMKPGRIQLDGEVIQENGRFKTQYVR